MLTVIEKAAQAVRTPEVEEMIKTLSKFGLGVYALHEHSSEDEFIPLGKNRIAVETNLKVSFQDRNELGANHGTPVAWAWVDGSVKTVAGCRNSQSGHN